MIWHRLSRVHPHGLVHQHSRCCRLSSCFYNAVSYSYRQHVPTQQYYHYSARLYYQSVSTRSGKHTVILYYRSSCLEGISSISTSSSRSPNIGVAYDLLNMLLQIRGNTLGWAIYGRMTEKVYGARRKQTGWNRQNQLDRYMGRHCLA
jgi:hypothetical protein